MTTDRAKSLISGDLPSSSPRFFVLIPCAGQGSRAQTPMAKQYQTLLGQPMVRHTVQAFRAVKDRLAALWVVIAPADDVFLNVFPDYNAEGEMLLAGGGNTRAATVLNGLKAMVNHRPDGAALTDWVLVHDAARCLITPAQILALIEACQHDEVGGLLAQKLPDTLKSEAGGRVAATIDRSDKWLAQTPQMFRIGALIAALEQAGDGVTDESSAIEAMGLSPKLVPGSAQNFKVTYPEDFALAEAILQSRAARSFERFAK
ncbi:2-C-methyl-D-erythritol 4-phosphate cytidylyltransferase [Polaromonas sp.]|uniref:2-C-methyl-D-erythritol 4-phosphate cytidylyltransferase n=1 Tax=Polaromonas sp. TaxID=1869339 RepID=UPI002FC9EE3F